MERSKGPDKVCDGVKHTLNVNRTERKKVFRKFSVILGSLITLAVTVAVCAFSISAHAANAAQVRIGGVFYASLGDGTAMDSTPGMEAVDLLNYAYTPKNLKGYSVKDAAGNRVWMCKNLNQDCTSTTADDDNDGTKNVNDSGSWLTLPPRSQTVVNLEARNDGPLVNNTSETLYLLNSVGTTLSVFKFSVSNPTS